MSYVHKFTRIQGDNEFDAGRIGIVFRELVTVILEKTTCLFFPSQMDGKF